MTKPFCWIETVAREEAGSELTAAYDEVCRADGSVHNMYQAFATRPDLLVLADRFFRALLHNPRRRLEAWAQELVTTYVAILCDCRYAREHHGANLMSLLGDRTRGRAMLAALEAGEMPAGVDARMRAILTYTRKLTVEPAAMVEADVAALRAAGLDDAEIFEVNQIAAHFAYWVRMLNGLGVTADGERIGLHGDGPRADAPAIAGASAPLRISPNTGTMRRYSP